jgi:hypothetical protein
MELSIHRDDKARELIVDLVDASRTKLDDAFAVDPRYEVFKSRFTSTGKTPWLTRETFTSHAASVNRC